MTDAPIVIMLDATLAGSLCARDLMQTDVLTVYAEAPLADVHRMFVTEGIHGAPVVDDDDAVCGVITSLDLLRPGAENLDETLLTASDIMTRELVAVPPAMAIGDVARLMRDQHVHRVLVIEDHELLGVLTTFDLLRVFA